MGWCALTGKRTYLSQGDAARDAEELTARLGEKIHAYPHGDHFHVGHKNRRRVRGVDQTEELAGDLAFRAGQVGGRYESGARWSAVCGAYVGIAGGRVVFCERRSPCPIHQEPSDG